MRHKGFARERMYECRCQDSGWVQVSGEYVTAGGIRVPAEMNQGALRRCEYCNTERPPQERKRRDIA